MREPKDAPVGKLKCWPRVGFRGEVSVKPRRLRVVAINIVQIVIFVLDLSEKDDLDIGGDDDVWI